MGNIKFPTLGLYWSRNSLYYHPIFGRTMGRNRFQTILSNLRFVDHGRIDREDRLYKVRPIITRVLKNIRESIYPDQPLAIDEALILWRGRLAFRQYISNKRHKYGIKLYELTTDDGFILNIIIYVGKGTLSDIDSTHTQSVVKECNEAVLTKGACVELAEYLLKNKTTMVGTLKENRKGNPKSVVKAKLKKGECVWKRKGGVVVTNWKDKRNVRMISTRNKHRMKETTSRKGAKKMKPECVVEYNSHMSGIDLSDQMLSYYSAPRKTIRWYRKIFFRLLDVCIWDSCYIYNNKNPKKLTHLKFRDQIIRNLIGINNEESVDNNDTKLQHQDQFHFPEPIPGGKKKVKRCKLCTKSKIYKRSRFQCGKCFGNPGLCIFPCFRNWHINAVQSQHKEQEQAEREAVEKS
jgi:hypothetical protein